MYDGDKGTFYDAFEEKAMFKTLDGLVYAANLDAALGQIRAANEETAPSDEEIARRLQIAFDKTKDLLNRCGLSAGWFDQDIVRSHGEKYLKRKIDAYYAS